MDAEGQPPKPAPTAEYLSAVKVFPLIPHLKQDVTENIDSALSWEQLTASDINFAIIRPIVFKYARLRNLAIVYACLVVRSHFLSLAVSDLAHANVMASRAMMCELLAMKLLRHFANDQLALVAVLTTSWNPIAGAPQRVVDEVKDALGGDEDSLDDASSALELAIVTKSKTFLSSPLVQTVVDDIYKGRIIFSTMSTRSLLADNYKLRSIEIYDVRKAPFLNHYRLRVPKYAAMLEFLNFFLLLVTFVLSLSAQARYEVIGGWEVVFMVVAFAFLLSEYASAREHGWDVYMASMWNVFDTSFLLIFLAYFVLRMKGWYQNDSWAAEYAFDILACGACILFPRLAFFAIKNNVVILALRGMIADFVFFMCVAAVCFSGLLFTLWTLGSNNWPVTSIMWLMVQIWFGNTFLSFTQANSFHPVFGPILMTMFAALSNTLLLTILISILSNTFARIDENASREYLFQYTISTIEGFQSDALYSYQPPFNLLAYVILLPLSFVLSPRALHTVNVFLIKVTSFPILILIGIYERYLERGLPIRESSKEFYNSLPRNIKSLPLVDALVGSRSSTLYDAIFDVADLWTDNELGLFGSDDEDLLGVDERPELRSMTSRESLTYVRPGRAGSRTPTKGVKRRSQQHHMDGNGLDSLQQRERTTSTPVPQSPGLSPPIRRTAISGHLTPNHSSQPPTATSTDAPSFPSGMAPSPPLPLLRSPLARLFTAPRMIASMSDNIGSLGLAAAAASSQANLAAAVGGLNAAMSEEALAGVKRLETLMEGLRDMPVHKLKDEMKELQERQARIEGLLLTLTRGMRNEVGSAPSRHGST